MSQQQRQILILMFFFSSNIMARNSSNEIRTSASAYIIHCFYQLS